MKAILFIILLLHCAIGKVAKYHAKTHDQAQIAAELAGKAFEKVLDDPYSAAQIGTKFVQGYVDGIKSLFGGADDLKGRSRSLQLTIGNGLDNDLLIVESYFDSGTFYTSFDPIIVKRSIVSAYVANKQGSWFTGVTGGLKLQIRGTSDYIFFGFTNPYIGSYKFSMWIASSGTAKDAYNRANDNNPKYLEYKKYALSCKQVPTKNAQMAFVLTIKKL